MGLHLPLQPLLDGLEVLLRGLGRDRAAEVFDVDAAVIEPLLGSIHAGITGVGVPVPADPGEALGRLFAALLRVVERAGSSPEGGPAVPVLVVIDDLHLAGPSTLEWLRFAARRGTRLRLVLASRSAVVPVPEGAKRIELGPLDLAAAGRLVAGLIGAPVDAARVEALWTRSGGSPVLLHALATAPGDAVVAAGGQSWQRWSMGCWRRLHRPLR